jgi:hypothetical protein
MTAPLHHRLTRATAILASVLATIVLTACGSSSSSTTTSTGTTATGTASAGSAQQRAAIQACLKKAGISIPSRPAGSTSTTPRTSSTPRSGGLFRSGGGALASNPKVRAALQKCGLSFGRRRAGSSQVSNPAYQRSVNNYVACVRKNGYNLPTPNFSGNGPVFNASQVNRNDPKFKAVSAKCQQLLNSGRTQTTTNSG